MKPVFYNYVKNSINSEDRCIAVNKKVVVRESQQRGMRGQTFISCLILLSFFEVLSSTALALEEMPLQFVNPVLARPQKGQEDPEQDLGDFSDMGAPRDRGSAGSRGECPPPEDSQRSLTALVPLLQTTVNGAPAKIPFSTTAETHPTFWFDFPYSADVIHSIRFVIVDEIGVPIATEPVPVAIQANPGLLSVKWPTDEAPLELEQSYRWFLLVDCQSPGTTDLFLEGIVRRMPMPAALQQRLTGVTSREQVFLYANESLWHEALTGLAELRRGDPSNPSLATDWQDLLESVELPVVAPSSGAASE